MRVAEMYALVIIYAAASVILVLDLVFWFN
jgi:hypothetical protein